MPKTSTKSSVLSRNRLNKAKANKQLDEVSSVTSSSDGQLEDVRQVRLPLINEERDGHCFDTFYETLNHIPGYPHLTKELETTGNITTFISTDPAEQVVEREYLIKLYNLKKEMELEHTCCVKRLQLIEAEKQTELMEMSLETIQKLAEKISGKPVEDFNELVQILATLQATQVEDMNNQEHIDDINNSKIFEENELWSPGSVNSRPLLSVSQTPSVAASSVLQYPNNIFPSSSEMVQSNVHPCTPAHSVYKFEGSSVMSTNKAPRLLKPGEIAFSHSGSPLMMPRLGALNRDRGGAESILMNDADGKKIVEVVLYKGEEDKEKEFKEFVTDVRGLIATKSIKVDRIRPPRVPRGPVSATKKTFWH